MRSSMSSIDKVKKYRIDLDEIIDTTAKESFEEWKNLGNDDNE